MARFDRNRWHHHSEIANLIFEAHQGETAPGLVLFYEVFADEAAFENHQQATYVQDWFDAIEGFTTIEMNVNRMTNFNTH